MSQDDTTQHALHIATPALMGKHLGKRLLGSPYILHPWLRWLEEKVLFELVQPGRKIIIVSVPPQNGKTTYFGLLLPVWYLGMNPGHQVIFISYNEPQASKWGLRSRDCMKRFGPELFGEGVHPNSDSQLDWKMTNGFGGMMSAGIKGGITGNPGHMIVCVTGESVVMTPSGPRRVDEIYLDGYDGVDVLSYHHPSGRELYAPVSAARRSQRSDLVRVTTEAGRTLTCTPDHRVWVEGLGYREAHLLQPGWPVRVVPGMWEVDPDQDEQGSGLEDVPPLLPPGSRLHRRVQLLRLRRHGVRGSRHVREATGARSIHLRPDVYGGRIHRSGAQEPVPMRQPDPEGSPVLLAPLPNEVREDHEVPAGHYLSDVWGRVRRQEQPSPVLHAEVRGPRPLDPDARQGEQPLQDGGFVHVRLPKSTPADHETRRWLRRLWDAGRPRRPSRRPRPAEQRLGESGDALQDAPRRPPQERLDAVSLVEHVRQESTDVYDLTVPRTGNFYVNGILIHNCDDLLKGDEDAGSVAAKTTIMGELQNSVFSRFQTNTKMFVIATRWAEDDPSGQLMLLSQQADYHGIPIESVNIKAVAEPSFEERQEMESDAAEEVDPDLDDGEREAQIQLVVQQMLADWTDFLGRRNGEALDGQFDQGFYDERRATVDSYGWNALYQGDPTAREGGMFPLDKWQYYTPTQLPDIRKKVRVWDLAASEGRGDYTVGTLMGRGSDGNFYILDRERGRWATDVVEQHVLDSAKRDGFETTIMIEQERAGAGKTVLESYKRKLVGYHVEDAKAEGSKQSRSTPYSNEQRKGNIYLPADKPWLKEWRDEHVQADGDKKWPIHDDQIDTGAYGFKFLNEGGSSEFWDPSQLASRARSLAESGDGELAMEILAMERAFG